MTIFSHFFKCLLLTAPAFACCGLAGSAQARQLVVDLPDALRPFLLPHLPALTVDADADEAAAAAARVERMLPELLATRGYFTPRITRRQSGDDWLIAVTPGPLCRVAQVELHVAGLSPQRQERLFADWPLPVGAPYRQDDWQHGKQEVLRRLLGADYPAARLIDSRAEVDPQAATARLSVAYDAGPAAVFGALRVEGLSRYRPELVQRLAGFRTGQPYREEALLNLQASLQNSPYFSAVSVESPPPEAMGGSTQEPLSVPILVRVSERQPYALGLGAGVSSNTGARVEASFRDADLFGRAWLLDSGLRLEQLRQSLYADVHLPPEAGGERWTYGAASEHEYIQSLRLHRAATAAQRVDSRGGIETRLSAKLQREVKQAEGEPVTRSRALTLDQAWTWRRLDDSVLPRRGQVTLVQAGGGTKALGSDQDFLRLLGRYQHYFPVGDKDVLQLRGELGASLARTRQGIPQDFLFRAGGTQSVRGYAYQSLGVAEGNAIVGGRYLATASAEYTHWLGGDWGVALFVDSGAAADQARSLHLASGYGMGARWRSPLGPLGVDLAYGERTRKLRLDFSLSIPF